MSLPPSSLSQDPDDTKASTVDSAPPAREDGLQARGFMGGLIADLRRRAPHYASDYRDGLHAKSLAATLFLFFACIAPAVAFGGLMSQLTGGAIGAMEMIVATAIGGVIYAITAGQPLTILGGTGPLLVFTGVLFELCDRLGQPFLPVYAWVGLWTGACSRLSPTRAPSSASVRASRTRSSPC
ncbi:MAG: hypothetical protein GXP55_14800 [Deltaproteobacteria bacterium]|nr:hypothetical protein [Deltaproteobacteria bacterium]